MKSIFFDLETTDKHTVGQIVNFAFVLVGDDWEILDTFQGNIKISRMQLPRIGAILANRVDVLEHQNNCEFQTERDAMLAIRTWIERIVETSREPVCLIGHNSQKFDVPYLRTVMIRNGINPYFPKSGFYYADTRLLGYYVAARQKDFHEKVLQGNTERPFSLENICHQLGLLEGKQEHESLADVKLTIAYAKYVHDNYGDDFDVRTALSYEPSKSMHKRGSVIEKIFPSRTEPGVNTVEKQLFYDAAGDYSLWLSAAILDEVDIMNGEEVTLELARKYGRWYNKSNSACLIQNYWLDPDVERFVDKVEESSGLRIDNFFPEKTCDVEQHIYQLDFSELRAFEHTMQHSNPDALKEIGSKLGMELFLRHKLAVTNNLENEKVARKFQEYVDYRYGGQMKLSKMNPESKFQPGVYSEDFHPTIMDLFAELDDVMNGEYSEEDKSLATSLKQFYQESDIMKFFKPDVHGKRVKPDENI